jgi:hypothetical protein
MGRCSARLLTCSIRRLLTCSAMLERRIERTVGAARALPIVALPIVALPIVALPIVALPIVALPREEAPV